MNATTFTFQIEGKGITTFGAFNISNPNSSKQVMTEVESKLKVMESILKERGFQFSITNRIHISQANISQEGYNSIPDLTNKDLMKHIQTIVTQKFDHLPKAE